MGQNNLENLRPRKSNRLIDLVEQAGLDVTPWGLNFSGKHPSQNPAFCYEWSFSRGEIIIINIWHENTQLINSEIFQVLNLRDNVAKEKGSRRRRSKIFDEHIRKAFENTLPVRAIIQDRNAAGGVGPRELDPEPWHVISYENISGQFRIVRSPANEPRSIEKPENYDEELSSFAEGLLIEQFVIHRKREAAIRTAKLKRFAETHSGRIFCEVSHCKMDFAEKYGSIGIGFAHVHHLKPLGDAPKEGRQANLSDLAVVCPNCHAMIHRGGQCRTLDEIDSMLVSQKSK